MSWSILLKTTGAKPAVSSMGNFQNLIGNSAFKTMTVATADGRESFGSADGFYKGFFTSKKITKLALVDGTSTSLTNLTGNTNYIIYDLVETSGSETMFEILNRLDTYAGNNQMKGSDAPTFRNPSVVNFTAGLNGYSGIWSARSSATPFGTSTFPDKICVCGINIDADDDIQVFAAYWGNLETGKGDRWRMLAPYGPLETLWSLWGNDYHNDSTIQRISAGIQTSPGINTLYSAYTGNVYLLALSSELSAAEYESTFTSHTFTNAGATGISGPTLSAVRTAYSSAAWTQDTTNNWLNMTSNNGIQLWTVPKTGNYKIQAVGAGVPYNSAYTLNGMSDYQKGMDATINTILTKGEVIRILVGQMPAVYSFSSNMSGAGGTFIVRGTQTPLIVAGGGGGHGSHVAIITSNATVNNTGQTGIGNNSTYPGGAGGSDGAGGFAGINSYCGGGGGLTGNGSNGTLTVSIGGTSFINGGLGGTSADGWSNGGFGGGGGAASGGGGGGGGGYSGGGGGGYNNVQWHSGGGGGSYSITNSFTSATANNSGQGSVVITLILTTPATLTFLKIAYYTKFILNSTITLPATDIITNNTDTVKTVTHTSGSTGVATITTAANVGTVTVKGLGTTTITSTLAATANFDAVTVSSITITVIGSGTTLTDATMTSIDLTSTDLTGSVFSGCDLTSANLYGAIFNVNTDLRGSTLTSLRSGRINGFTTLLPAGYKMI